MKEQKRNFKRKREIIEYTGSLGSDPEYEYREFHADEKNVILIPEGWELSFWQGDTVLYRRKKS
ncbi:hypothetical protein IID22_03210 [Patescibacteria group bacterium]|nr:hypothetical protein [Patescibacteria group bacterium]